MTRQLSHISIGMFALCIVLEHYCDRLYNDIARILGAYLSQKTN